MNITAVELAKGTRAAFRWLEDEGYEEADSIVLTGHFTLAYRSERGKVWIALDPSRSYIGVSLAPPELNVYADLPLNAFLRERGLPEVSNWLPAASVSLPATLETIKAHSDALAQLRGHELSGDWHLLERARKHDGALARDQQARRQALLDAAHQRQRGDKD